MIPSAGRSGTSPSISAFIPVLIHLFTRLLSQYPLINPHSGTGLSGVLGAGCPSALLYGPGPVPSSMRP